MTLTFIDKDANIKVNSHAQNKIHDKRYFLLLGYALGELESVQSVVRPYLKAQAF